MFHDKCLYKDLPKAPTFTSGESVWFGPTQLCNDFQHTHGAAVFTELSGPPACVRFIMIGCHFTNVLPHCSHDIS